MPNSFLNIGSLQSLGSDDLNNDSTTQKDRPGRYAYLVDSFGAKVYMYARNTRGSALSQGNLTSRLGDVAVTNITSGTTTSAVKATTWTANKHVGEILYVQDNDDSAGAAPEGEASIIGSNSAGVCNVDPAFPYSVALAANDDLDTITPGWHLIAAAASDKAQEIKGVVVSKNGIADLNYGYICCYGLCPVVTLKASTAFTDRAAIIADTAAIAPDANGGWELVIGYKIGTVSSDIVGTVSPAFLNLYAPTLNAGTP